MESTSHQLRSIATPLRWQRVESSDDQTPPQDPFLENVGSTLQMPPDSRPVDFFLHLMDVDICDQIVEETNRYAQNSPVHSAPSPFHRKTNARIM